MKRILLATVLLAAPWCQSEPVPPQKLNLRTTIQLHADIGISPSSLFNPRFFDGDIYVNQINTPAFGRYPQGSSTPKMFVDNSFSLASEHRMVAPFRGILRSTYLLASSSAATSGTTFTRYDFDGNNPLTTDVPDALSAAGFDWVDSDTIIYAIYTSGNRTKLYLADVSADPFTVTKNPAWNAQGFITTSVSTRIRNVRVGDVHSGYAYYGDAGQNTSPNFYAINLTTGAETLLGNAGTLTGTGSFGVWTVVERGGYLYVQTTDNGIQVYSMSSATSLGALHTTYTKELLTDLTGYSGQFWGFDVTVEGEILLGGTGAVFELGGPLRPKSYVMEPAWNIPPLEPYAWMSTNHLQRGLAYNPVSGNLLTVSRHPANGSGEVYVINSTNGTLVKNLSTNGIKYDKNFPINMIGVADDGAIYACSLAVNSISEPTDPISNNGPFRIYRWMDENADPVLAYEGDPSDNDPVAANRRFGDTIDIRGAGVNTEILCGTRQGNIVAVFKTLDGVNFTHTKIQVSEITSSTGTFMNSIAWGPGKTFYTKNDHPTLTQQFALQQFELTVEWGVATLRQTNANLTALGGLIGYDPERNLLAIVKTVTASAATSGIHEVRLFKLTAAGMVQQDHPQTSRLFPGNYNNGNGVGAVAFGGGKLFALAANNGIVAFNIKEVVVEPQIFWTETGGFNVDAGSVWSAAFDGSGRTPIATGLNRPIGIAVDEINGHLYWAEDGVGLERPSRIVRARLDGTGQEVLFDELTDGFTNAQMLALDLANGHVYWTDFMLGVLRGNLDGTGLTVLSGLGSRYTALALDLVNQHIYYGDPMQNGVLFRCDLSGANQLELARDIAQADFRFNSIAVDAANGFIYYTDTGTHEIKRMDLNGANQAPLLQDSGLAPLGIALRPDGTLFWVGAGQRLGTAKVDGSSAVDLSVVGIGSTPFGIAVLAKAPVSDIQITGIGIANSTVTVTWEGGVGPFQLQRRSNVAQGAWENVGNPTESNQATDNLGTQQMYYRVKGN